MGGLRVPFLIGGQPAISKYVISARNSMYVISTRNIMYVISARNSMLVSQRVPHGGHVIHSLTRRGRPEGDRLGQPVDYPEVA